MDLWGLAPEYEWYKNNKAAIIGTTVHNLVALGLRADQSANDWGGGDARFRNTSFTWPTGIGQKGKGTLMPDAYYVSQAEKKKELNDFINPNPIFPKGTFNGKIWELKPESWMQKNSKSNYKKAQNQISDYLTSPKKGCWTAGLSTTIFTKVNSLGVNSIPALGKTYNIKFHTDTVSNASGLFFYSYTEQKKKEQNQLENVEVPDVVPAANKKQFEKVKDGFVALAKNSGLTALEIAGLVLLIILMIAVLRYPPAILAVLALLTSALSHARGKDEKGAAVQKVSLMESTGVALGIDNLSTADLLKKGKEYAAKKWDNVTKLFTGWFD